MCSRVRFLIFCLAKTKQNFLYHWFMSLVTRKPVFEIFDQVRHKPACSATEASERLEILGKKLTGLKVV